MTATKGQFFNPEKLSSRDKAEATDHTARAIIAQEATEREKKTEKLKLLRLQQEAAATPPAAKPAKKSKATAAARQS